MIYRRSFCENDVFLCFWSTGAIMFTKLSNHDGNWFPTCNIIILVFQIMFSTFKALIFTFNNANAQYCLRISQDLIWIDKHICF